MFQVTFSEQSLRELQKSDTLGQLEIIEPLSNLTPAQLANPREPLGRFHREGHEFYRLRSGDYRIYFELKGESLHTRYLLHRNSLADFVFRAKLPADDHILEENPSFWKYLESLTR
jgi:mRNA-degrading endonuclease RelE of RelBE toxin-antitoxin system